jgi:hypothetical protein
MGEGQRQPYFRLAQAEKEAHAVHYPNYRYTPRKARKAKAKKETRKVGAPKTEKSDAPTTPLDILAESVPTLVPNETLEVIRILPFLFRSHPASQMPTRSLQSPFWNTSPRQFEITRSVSDIAISEDDGASRPLRSPQILTDMPAPSMPTTEPWDGSFTGFDSQDEMQPFEFLATADDLEFFRWEDYCDSAT